MDIRVIPHETVPRSIHRVLLPHERDGLITVRFHPAILARPVAEVLGGLALAGLLTATIAREGAVLLAVWGLWGILVLRLAYKVFCYLEDYFVVTSARLLLATGVLRKTVNMMPITKVTDMRFERSPLGRLLGYGTFIVESAGQDQALHTVDHLPYPEQLYMEVCGRIFKDPNAGDD